MVIDGMTLRIRFRIRSVMLTVVACALILGTVRAIAVSSFRVTEIDRGGAWIKYDTGNARYASHIPTFVVAVPLATIILYLGCRCWYRQSKT
jgi:hypothetical protein